VANLLPRGLLSFNFIFYCRIITMLRSALFVAMSLGVFVLTGCGGGVTSVSGQVTLDGKPVEGATVTFITEDGKQSATGQTDAEGNFSLSDSGKPGVRSGSYKVLVTRSKPVTAPGEGASQEDMQKAMKKIADEDAKAAAAKAAKPGGNDPASKMKAAAAASGANTPVSGVKTDLPTIYAAPTTTPLTVKVPPESQPVKIELKSKP